MTHKKITFTIPNKLYGDKEATGYGSKGLVAHKLGRGWTVSQVSSGMAVRGGSVWATKAEALGRLEKLIALPVPWEKSWEEMSSKFSEHREAIREIVMAF